MNQSSYFCFSPADATLSEDLLFLEDLTLCAYEITLCQEEIKLL